jgi:hypothetical protein
MAALEGCGRGAEAVALRGSLCSHLRVTVPTLRRVLETPQLKISADKIR